MISGTAAIPLLLAELWSVYPRLLLPMPRRAAAAIERFSLVPLVGGSLFMLFTGTANIARWYPWPFFFPRGHYWGAWITIGALVTHVGARASSARVALTSDRSVLTPVVGVANDHDAPRIGRRTLIGWVGGASLALTAVTAGQTVPFLRRFVLFAPRRPDIGPQAIPVNHTAGEAGVSERAQDPNWRLVIESDGSDLMCLDLPAVRALAQRTATLPIACVEGWSASAQWSGVSVTDILQHAKKSRPTRASKSRPCGAPDDGGSAGYGATESRDPDPMVTTGALECGYS